MSVPIFLEEYVLLALLAGLLAVDDRAGWQSLLAQPVFAALLVGAIAGEMTAALMVGVVLELVWLSHLPMRGTRRADTVAGAVIGIGTTCILIRYTGDPRISFLVATGAFVGLFTGQGLGYITRWLGRVRDGRIASFGISEGESISVTARRLSFYHFVSLTYQAVAAIVVVLVFLPPAVFLAERFTAMSSTSLPGGAGRWLELLPVFGIGAIVHSFWHHHLNRFLILSACVVLVVLVVR